MHLTKNHKSYFGLVYIATAEQTNGRYFISETVVPAGDPGPPPHIHSKEDESFYVISGELTFVVNGEEVALRAGEFLNIEKGEKHTWKNNSSSPARLLVTFAPAGIEEMFVELENNPSDIKNISSRYGTRFDL